DADVVIYHVRLCEPDFRVEHFVEIRNGNFTPVHFELGFVCHQTKIALRALNARRSTLLRGALDVDFAELLEIDLDGRVRHQVAATIVFRKRDYVTDRISAGDQHHEPIEPECDAAVWRCTE